MTIDWPCLALSKKKSEMSCTGQNLRPLSFRPGWPRSKCGCSLTPIGSTPRYASSIVAIPRITNISNQRWPRMPPHWFHPTWTCCLCTHGEESPFRGQLNIRGSHNLRARADMGWRYGLLSPGSFPRGSPPQARCRFNRYLSSPVAPAPAGRHGTSQCQMPSRQSSPSAGPVRGRRARSPTGCWYAEKSQIGPGMDAPSNVDDRLRIVSPKECIPPPRPTDRPVLRSSQQTEDPPCPC